MFGAYSSTPRKRVAIPCSSAMVMVSTHLPRAAAGGATDWTAGDESATGGARLGRALPADALHELRTGAGGRPAGAGGHQSGRRAASGPAGGAGSLALRGDLPALWGDEHGRLPGGVRAHAGLRAASRS